MAGDYLSILQGDSYTFSTNVTVDGVAQNIAGATLWFMAKNNVDDADADAIINATTTGGQIQITGANSSVVTVTLNTAYTANLAEANGAYWALKCRTAGCAVYSLDRGRLAISGALPVATS